MEYNLKTKRSMNVNLNAQKVTQKRNRSRRSDPQDMKNEYRDVKQDNQFKELCVSDDDWLDAEDFYSNNGKRFETIDSRSERQNNLREVGLVSPKRS